MGRRPTLPTRAARHAALGDVGRLAIVDALRTSDLAPVELAARVDMTSNLLAHHLDVLERVGIVERRRSSGDARRRYVRLRADALATLDLGARLAPRPALFVCTANSARSQLAAALWRVHAGAPAASAGTAPADEVHPGARAAARRHDLPLGHARPRSLEAVRHRPDLVITVCDRAHEELGARPRWLHWSVPDPVPRGTASAFDATVQELEDRITALLAEDAR